MSGNIRLEVSPAHITPGRWAELIDELEPLRDPRAAPWPVALGQRGVQLDDAALDGPTSGAATLDDRAWAIPRRLPRRAPTADPGEAARTGASAIDAGEVHGESYAAAMIGRGDPRLRRLAAPPFDILAAALDPHQGAIVTLDLGAPSTLDLGSPSAGLGAPSAGRWSAALAAGAAIESALPRAALLRGGFDLDAGQRACEAASAALGRPVRLPVVLRPDDLWRRLAPHREGPDRIDLILALSQAPAPRTLAAILRGCDPWLLMRWAEGR